MISVAPEPAPFRILGYSCSFLKRRIPNHQSIVVNAAKSGGQEEMLKRRAYCSQISWVRQVFIAHNFLIKSSRWTKNNLYSLNNASLFRYYCHTTHGALLDIGTPRLASTPLCRPIRDHKFARS